MKILIFCEQVGRTAPGLVYEKLIEGLVNEYEVDLVTNNYEPTNKLKNLNKIIKTKYFHIPHKYVKFLFSYFKFNPIDFYWAFVNKCKLYFLNKEYDLVISFLSFHNYSNSLAGYTYIKHNKGKHFIYSVDAVPAPIGWSVDDDYYRNIRKLMARILPSTDALFSANSKMLEYQLSTFKKNDKMHTGVLYPPINKKFLNLPYNNFEMNIFLYTGSIYGARKVNYLFGAFKELLKTNPDSKLVFVGTTLSERTLSIFTPVERSKIEIFPSTSKLEPFYKVSTALIDIDADLPNDIYISSKIFNYINTNRIIISETGLNSPSRKLFKNIESVFQCNHNETELYNAMLKAIKYKDKMKFDDRKVFCANITIQKSVLQLISTYNKLNYEIN